MQFHRKTLCAVFIFISAAEPVVFAQSSTARFLYYRPNAVSSAMGGIGTAYFHDANAACFNPAGLAFAPTMTLAGSFDQPLPIFPGEANSFIGASLKIPDLFTVAGSVNLYWEGDEALTGINAPDVLVLYAPFDWQGKVSFACRVGQNIGVGASVSLLESTFGGLSSNQEPVKSSAVTFDLGFLASSLLPEVTITPGLPTVELPFENLIDHGTQKGISIGASFLNLGPKISLFDGSISDPPPSALLIGATYYPVQTPLAGLMIGLDAEKRLYDGGALSYLHYGSELTLLHVLALRAGYSQGTAAGERSFFTFGGGIRLKYFSLNFARYVQAILPTWQFDATLFMEI